jgi:RecA/RadA recombinase
MAKKKSSASNWNGQNQDSNLNSFFESMRQTAQNELGGSSSIGDQSMADLVGLRLPALCLRYLFQSTTFPLSRMIQITGEEGSAKSAFLYEIFRWHMNYGGGAVLAENENKDSPELRNSILQWNPTWMNRMVKVETFSLEDWQDVFTNYIRVASEQQDAQGGPGRTVPICFAVDSLMATAPRCEIEAVHKDGHASRGYAIAANLIARYMRTMPERIKFYPFTLAGTNHLKPGTDARGLPTSAVPGGKAVKFMETYEIEMKKAQNADIDLVDYGGLRLRFIARKNSLGPSRKSITAELLWWNAEDAEGNFKQQTAWDWNTATIDLFAAFENAKGKKTIFNRLCDITGIRIASRSQRTAYSEILGIPKSDPQLYRTVAAVLETRSDILDDVYKVLGIHKRFEFQPGRDYLEMKQAAEQRAVEQTTHLYAGAAELPATTDVLASDGDFEVEAEPREGDEDDE